STIQWKNLLPLIRNSLAEGNFTLIVGDVKQSIYRWRGGNIQLLAGEIKNNLNEFSPLIKEENLVVNRRSRQNVVDFNNKFFTTTLSKLNEFYDGALSEMYTEDDIVQQTDEKNISGGFVNIKFISDEVATDSGSQQSFKEQAMENVLNEIKALLTEGYDYKDIALLFRKNDEGNAMAEYLFRNGITKVISPDSLLLSGSENVRFLIALFRYMVNQNDVVSRAHVLHFYKVNAERKSAESLHEIFSDAKSAGKILRSRKSKKYSAALFDTKPLENNLFNKILPDEFISGLTYLLNLPVYELCENLIRIFHLNELPDAYIQRFQDCVLEHTRKGNSSVLSFLEWWDENNEKGGNSVLLPDSENAIRIMTLHKAKGLQFPIVFIPFFNWKIMPPLETLLWTWSDVTPFSDVKKIAIRFGSSLENTVFKAHYSKEKINYISDAFNMIYVAFTRAMERMYVISQSVKLPVSELKNSKDILAAVVAEMTGTDESKEFIIGEKSHPTKKAGKENTSSVLLNEYISEDWRNKISVSEKNSLPAIIVKEQLKKIAYGSAVHRVLSAMKTTDDLETEVDELFYAGTIDQESKMEMIKRIHQLFKNEKIKNFFSEEWDTLSEREILLPDGKILRPDRVLIKGRDAVVIDFKTGKEKPEDARQVKT
ncbi:MAG: UvrD-helicase domain-containing protein, partial [Bacteroidia bacterium]|nr:UvrD-helicase domain-containing protein [Bacteroidia bacterium]